MKKRVFTGLIVAAMAVSMMTTTVSAAAPETAANPEGYLLTADPDNFDEDSLNEPFVAGTEMEAIVSRISDAIAEFYYSKDISGTFAADSIFQSDVADYLSDKIDTQQYATKLYNLSKENYHVDVSLKTCTEMPESNILSFEFQVVTTYNYVGRSFDSSSSELVNVLYDCATNEIIEFYTPKNYYDEGGRLPVAVIDKSQSGMPVTLNEYASKIWQKLLAIWLEVC